MVALHYRQLDNLWNKTILWVVLYYRQLDNLGNKTILWVVLFEFWKRMNNSDKGNGDILQLCSRVIGNNQKFIGFELY